MPRTCRITQSVVLSILCFSPSLLPANITPVTRGHVEGGIVLPSKATDVRVLREQLTIDITPIEKRHVTPLVSVVAEYELRHDGPQPIVLEAAFPLAGAFEEHYMFRGSPDPTQGLGFEVTVDGAAVQARDEVLPIPRTARSATLWARSGDVPDKSEQARLTASLTRWVAADPKLSEALAEYARIAPSWKRYSAVLSAFEDEAKAVLTRKHLTHSVNNYLRNPTDFSAVSELIAEADPGKRKQVGENAGHYVSAVPQSPPPDDQTVAGYRKMIDDWLATRPAIAERHAELMREYDVQKVARQFIASRVANHLRDEEGLSELAVARLVQYLEHAYNPNPRGFNPQNGWAPKATTLPTSAPDEWLVAQLDPNIERERQRRIAEADELLSRYGFDATFLSPLTGLGYDRRVGWRDDSTWPILKFDAPRLRDEQIAMGRGSFEANTYAERITSPRSEAKLIRFNVPLQPGQTRTLRVSYRALAEIDDLVMGQPYASQIVHVRYILKTARNWKSFGPIDLTVTLPKSGLVVMEPPPTAQRDLEGGRIGFDAKVENVETNLRIAWLPVTNAARSALLDSAKRADLPDLRKLESAVTHPQARRVLAAMIALADQPERTPQSAYAMLRGAANLIGAGFAPDEAIMMGAPGDNWGSRDHAVREVRLRHDHVRDLALIGWRDHRSVFAHYNAFPTNPHQPIWAWSPEDREIAADWLARIHGDAPTPAARLARAYVALLGAPKPSVGQFAEFLNAARANDSLKHVALSLVSRFPNDPRGFAPLAMEVLAKPTPTSTVPDPLPYNIYVAACNAFAHGAAAPLEDALQLLDKLDDFQVARSYRIGEWYGSELGSARMRAICDRVVRSPKDAHPDGWIRALNRIDPAGAREALAAWAKDGGLDAAAVKRIEEQLDRGY